MLYGVIAITAILLIILVVLNSLSLNKIKKDFKEYTIHSDKMDLYSSIEANVLRMRIQAKDILIEDASLNRVERFKKFYEKVNKRLDESIALASDETKETLKEIDSLTQKYHDSVLKIVNLIHEDNKLIDTITKFKNKFKKELKDAIDDEDDLLEGLDALLSSQFELLKFKITMSKTDEEKIENDLKTLNKDIEKIKYHVKRLKTLSLKYKELEDEYHQYRNLVESVIKNIHSIKTILNKTDNIGHNITKLAQNLKIKKRKYLHNLEEDLIANINSIIVEAISISLIIVLIIGSILYYVSRVIIKEIALIEEFLNSDTNNLTRRLNFKANNEIGEIARSIDNFISKMQQALTTVQNVSKNVSNASNLVNTNAKDIENNINTEHQKVINANSLTQKTQEEMNEVNLIIEKMHKLADNSYEKLKVSVDKIIEFIENIKVTSQKDLEVANKVRSLKESTEQVKQVINIISEIADQTNLLALNAAIEAARAGEHGRGFAVVADEVRKLAEKTQNSLNEINTTINLVLQGVEEVTKEIQNNVETIEKITNEASEIETNVEDVLHSIEETKQMADETAQKSNTLSSIINTISQTMNEIKALSDKNEISAQEIEEVVTNLKTRVKELEKEINKFKL
jgi:methyl-accepting chemotaxis protein